MRNSAEPSSEHEWNLQTHQDHVQKPHTHQQLNRPLPADRHEHVQFASLLHPQSSTQQQQQQILQSINTPQYRDRETRTERQRIGKRERGSQS